MCYIIRLVGASVVLAFGMACVGCSTPSVRCRVLGNVHTPGELVLPRGASVADAILAADGVARAPDYTIADRAPVHIRRRHRETRVKVSETGCIRVDDGDLIVVYEEIGPEESVVLPRGSGVRHQE